MDPNVGNAGAGMDNGAGAAVGGAGGAVDAGAGGAVDAGAGLNGGMNGAGANAGAANGMNDGMNNAGLENTLQPGDAQAQTPPPTSLDGVPQGCESHLVPLVSSKLKTVKTVLMSLTVFYVLGSCMGWLYWKALRGFKEFDEFA